MAAGILCHAANLAWEGLPKPGGRVEGWRGVPRSSLAIAPRFLWEVPQ
jgi:hypothetical protein